MTFELEHTCIEDVEDVLKKVEQSFNLKFEPNELSQIQNFGDLCDYLANKIQLTNTPDCTTQQAFYKLRNVLPESTGMARGAITPSTPLVTFLPRFKRRLVLKQIEEKLGFKLALLSPPDWITIPLVVICLASLPLLAIHWQTGLTALLFSIAGFYLADKTANELNRNTVGELAMKMASENYVRSRRDPNTFNKNEIGLTLVKLFSDNLFLNESKLTRNSRFNK